MANERNNGEQRVAVLVDCDNTKPEILEFALRMVAQFGRVVLRRGYGNHATLANKWQEALVRLAFTPCLQYQFASGKNTADIALALDAVEALFDARADTFCLVTSDSDFAHLCRKLRERGASVVIVGEAKTPDALRNASDQFFEWTPAEAAPAPATAAKDKPAAPAKAGSRRRTKAAPPPPPPPSNTLVGAAVAILAANSADGRVGLGVLGQYLKRTDPGFSPKAHGGSTLSDVVRNDPSLKLVADGGSLWVSPRSTAAEA